jgi:hypothetical protein
LFQRFPHQSGRASPSKHAAAQKPTPTLSTRELGISPQSSAVFESTMHFWPFRRNDPDAIPARAPRLRPGSSPPNRRFGDPWSAIDAPRPIWPPKRAMTKFQALSAQITINEANSTELGP